MSKIAIILHYFYCIQLLEEYNELVSVNMLGVRYGETFFIFTTSSPFLCSGITEHLCNITVPGIITMK